MTNQINFGLPTEQRDLIAKHEDFVKKNIIPNAQKYDELAEFPWKVIHKAYDAGLMNSVIPKKFGGHECTIMDSALIAEEFGAGCVGIGISLVASDLGLTPWVLGANDEQKKEFFGKLIEKKGVAAYCLTEPNAGSDVAAIASTAIKKGDKYILNGHKRFITNAEVASYFTVFALTDPERGARSLTAIIVDAESPGIEIKPRMKKMGQSASVQNEIIFTDVEIPAKNVIQGENYGFILAMKTFDRTRTGVAALSVGAARSAFEISLKWSKNRTQFGKQISSNQAIAFMLADMATEIEAARMLTWRAAWAYDNKQKDASKLSAMGKMYASDMAMKVAIDAVQIMGGDGYSKDYPVEKIMRDVKLCQIYEGTNQIQRLVISKAILK